ncbi:MAG: alkaline phosphatase, partial [Verrucomicrobiaceae bacterium]|nr:alkaline phosphatase [Verrucomicrobiaceae bacterium]
SGLLAAPLFAADEALVRIGLITDLHYADKDPRGSRHYRDTLLKIAEAGTFFARSDVDFVVELGDLIDAADSVEVEKGYLQRIHREFTSLASERHCVLGNHCVDTLTKSEFLGEVGQAASYYSFDRGGVHFIVLDACFRSDGVAYERKNFVWTDSNLPPAEVEWLRGDLTAATGPVVVFVHQRLDVEDNHGVKNAAAIRDLLEGSGKVLGVFQGHSHKNDRRELGGIHYTTLRAMVEGAGVENNGYALLEIFPGGVMKLTGERLQESHRWTGRIG